MSPRARGFKHVLCGVMLRVYLVPLREVSTHNKDVIRFVCMTTDYLSLNVLPLETSSVSHPRLSVLSKVLLVDTKS